MIRLCLVLFSCCFLTTFANNQIDEIIKALRKMEQNLPPSLANDYFQIPAYARWTRCPKHTLPKLTDLLTGIREDCREPDCNKEFLGHLGVADANLNLLSVHVEKCPNLQQAKGCPEGEIEVKMRQCLSKVEDFLLRLKQRMCNKTH